MREAFEGTSDSRIPLSLTHNSGEYDAMKYSADKFLSALQQAELDERA